MDVILLLKKVVLAIIQGISEILPVSSSGHLILLSRILDIDTNGLSLIIFLHFGSLFAMIVFYRKQIAAIVKSLYLFIFKHNRDDQTKANINLFLALIIASIPAALVGFLLGDLVDTYLTNVYFVFIFLTLTGIILLLNKNLNGNRSLKELNLKQSFIVGLFQAIGVIPGISRSGITIFGGKVEKLSNEEAANFSFLLFLPVTLGSFLWEIIRNYQTIAALSHYDLLADAISVVIAGIMTYLAIALLFKLIKKGKLHYFAYYCFGVAVIGSIISILLSL